MNGGFLVTKVKQLSDRIFERILSAKNIDAFNGAQGRILYVLWQEDGIPIKALSMLERMERQELIRRIPSEQDKRKTLLLLTDRARALKTDYDDVSSQMNGLFYRGFSQEEISRFEHDLERVLLNLEDWQES